MKIGSKRDFSTNIFQNSETRSPRPRRANSDFWLPFTFLAGNKFSWFKEIKVLLGAPSGYIRFLLFNLILLLLVFLSCAYPPRVYLRPETKVSGFKTIAVLPFDNFSEEEGAGEKVTEIFTIELMRSGKFLVIEPGQVKKAIMEKRIRTTRDIDLGAAKSLGEELNSDLILVGTVLDFQMQKFDNKEVPVITLISRLVQANTGATVWAAYQSRRGNDKETFFGWGRVTSLSQLASVVASEMIKSLNE